MKELLKIEYVIGSGVERLNKEFGTSQSDHVAVTDSKSAIMSLGNFLGKAQTSVDTKPEELPD